MKERVIIVPKDVEAEAALNYNEARKEQLIEVYLTENEFNALYQFGFFSLINNIANVNIDDYEDECITNSSDISNVLKLINVKEMEFSEDTSNSIINIKKILNEALKRGTGVYFYF